MNALNTRTARVIDPVLSGIAQGYRHAQRVGHVIFPSIPVLQRGGKVIEFGLESFYNYKARRAPGADTMSIQFGYEGKPFSLDQYSLDAPVPREFVQDAETVPGVDMGKRAVNTVMESLTLSLEIEQGQIASDPANYSPNNRVALSGDDRWDDPVSNPIADVEAAKDQVRTTCGVEPTRMVVANAGFKALKQHPKIIEWFKYTTGESIMAKMLASLFDLEELAVGKAVYMDDVTEQPAFKEAWDNMAVLAYTPTQDAAMEQPSYGYTYTLSGHPFVEPPRRDGGKRSWVKVMAGQASPALGKYGPIEVFRTGAFTDMSGNRQAVTEDTLRELAEGYDRDSAPAPVVIGHPQTDAPAYGWVETLFVQGGILKATLEGTAATFSDMVKAGHYKRVSISAFPPQSTANPKPGNGTSSMSASSGPPRPPCPASSLCASPERGAVSSFTRTTRTRPSSPPAMN